jgi:Bifunctional DNA primase/polymerase, N-terminal
LNPASQAKSDPLEPIAHLRRGLITHGYRVVACVGKEARGDNWQYSRWTPDQMDGLTRTHHYATNTGLVCGELVGLDIDTPDQETADAILAMVAELPGFAYAPYRIGQAPKSLYAFRAAEPRDKVTTGKYLIRGHACQIEIFGRRNQFVAYGTHPDTGRGYEWHNGSPAETPLADLPEITTSDIDALLARAESYFAEHGTPIKKAKAANDNERGGEAGGDPDHPWSIVKQSAYANLSAWVPDLGLKDLDKYQGGYHSVASFRPTNSTTAKKRGKALNIQPAGIVDYAAGNKGCSPIDLVEACLGLTPHQAFEWLRERVGLPDDGTKPVSVAGLKAQPERRAEAAANDNSVSDSPPMDLWAHRKHTPLPAGLLPQIIEDFARVQGDLMGVDPGGACDGRACGVRRCYSRSHRAEAQTPRGLRGVCPHLGCGCRQSVDQEISTH